jgi:hypothetical protein
MNEREDAGEKSSSSLVLCASRGKRRLMVPFKMALFASFFFFSFFFSEMHETTSF